MASKILIIKLGAMGDVLRTTPLLRILDGDIYWVTKKESIPLLPVNHSFLKQIVDIEKARNVLSNIKFDLVVSLDDDLAAAELATQANKKILIGSFLTSLGKLDYTDTAREWFDMGLISKFGKEKADNLKKKNNKTYQEIIFGMAGGSFKGEEYIINFTQDKPKKEREKILIGIEERADKRWPTKVWNRFDKLATLLKQDGYEIKFFQQRDTVKQYIEDINECNVIVTGDTLAMHIALALKIKTLGIFTCTSPAEIYDYGKLVKVVSPLLEKAFYRREYIPEAVEAITLEKVNNILRKMIQSRGE